MRRSRNKLRTALVLVLMLALTSCQKGKEEEPKETTVPVETEADENNLFSDKYLSQSQLYTNARLLIETYNAETLNNAFRFVDCEKEVKNKIFKNGVHTFSEGYLLDSYNIILTGVSPIDSRNYKFFVNFTATYTNEDETGYLDKSYIMIMYYNESTLKDIELIQN